MVTFIRRPRGLIIIAREKGAILDFNLDAPNLTGILLKIT